MFCGADVVSGVRRGRDGARTVEVEEGMHRPAFSRRGGVGGDRGGCEARTEGG